MKILVTGGAGYVGSHCLRLLCDRGHHTVVLDNLVTGFRAAVDKRARFVQADLGDLSALPAGQFALAVALGEPIGCAATPPRAA